MVITTEPAAPVRSPPAARPVPPAAPADTGGGVLAVLGAALSILAVVALGFVGQMTLLGELSQARAQKVAYADFRAQLALATAPVGHLGDDGKPLASGTAVAVLQIPGIGVHQVVFEGTTGAVLVGGPGHRRDTVLPGQAGVSVLMGRRAAYGGPFARIGELRGGDQISVVTGQGTHTYRVLGVRRAGEPQPPALAAGAGQLTLVTADGPAYLPRDVLRVDADLVSQVQTTPALAVTATTLPAADQAMGIDPIALVPLVLWGQVLVAAAAGVAWIRRRRGLWHAWLIGLPLLGVLGVLVAGECARLLPNLL